MSSFSSAATVAVEDLIRGYGCVNLEEYAIARSEAFAHKLGVKETSMEAT